MSEPEPDSSRSSGESNSNVGQQVLSNELLLKEIIQNLNTMDLMNCRLVNKEYWEGVVTRSIQMENWEKRKFLKFCTPEEIQTYCDVYGHPGEKTSRVPFVLFSCFRVSYSEDLGYTRCPSSPKSNYLALEKLIQTFPNKIKSLDLELDLLQVTTEVLKPVLASQWSSLTELRLVYKSPSYSFVPLTHVPVDNTHYSLPNLKYLCMCDGCQFIKYPRCCNTSYQRTILDFICSKIPPENQIKMCLLPWGSKVDDTITVLTKYQLINALKVYKLQLVRSGDFRILDQSRVQLEFLVINPLQAFPSIAEEICQFLQSQRDCLEMLEWHGEEFEFPPIMENLSKLKLDSTTDFIHPEVHDAPAQHTPILYGQQFPKLEVLELSSSVYLEQPLTDFHSKFLVPQFPCSHLQVLRLRNASIRSETINLISEIFPTIRILDVGKYDHDDEFGPEEKRQFYSSLWRGNFGSTLEEFSISFDLDWSYASSYGVGRQRDWINYELDSLFSGLDRRHIAQLNFSQDFPYENNFQFEIDSPSILNFKNLKKLEIFAKNKIHSEGPKRGFTDFSAFALFGQLKKLEYLHIGAKVRQFSERGVKFLRMQSKITNGQNEVAMKTNDLCQTSTERIEKAFKTDWNLTNDDKNLYSFNLLNP